jgi:hypothetical protein
MGVAGFRRTLDYRFGPAGTSSMPHEGCSPAAPSNVKKLSKTEKVDGTSATAAAEFSEEITDADVPF